MSILICPHCQAPLEPTENRSYGCENNHQFDVAKEGYVNLLPVNQKKSKNPGDNEVMISARRNFLEEWHYDPLVHEVASLIQSQLTDKTAATILDTGCGEGYYTHKIAEQLQSISPQVYGTDISKYAVRLAAKRYKSANYFVSSVFNLPVADHSVDLIVSIFAPFDAAEFQRVLSEEGKLVIVSPAENHMKEIAELVYDEFRPHERTILEKIPEPFAKVETKRCSFVLDLNNNKSILNLLKMTPYYWSASAAQLRHFETIESIQVSCDFNISIFEIATVK
ncbi:putative RNA methyltransferase [Acidiluteibacter ferrifornacis]|uniref:Methyltransferase domain-containing protein n=1 Tax=Acidiluteibacter ferrifornacis TaxID=2692424 RepID=A0A6N9NIG4_9FLAO|nr:methyltransferase domain-containing protein [Acidiluteibacter ferrifornacis]NBG66486.1 methyltransferase domain-containing protein [Acidiluteibacter ferrifornacis]